MIMRVIFPFVIPYIHRNGVFAILLAKKFLAPTALASFFKCWCHSVTLPFSYPGSAPEVLLYSLIKVKREYTDPREAMIPLLVQ